MRDARHDAVTRLPHFYFMPHLHAARRAMFIACAAAPADAAMLRLMPGAARCQRALLIISPLPDMPFPIDDCDAACAPPPDARAARLP